MRKAILFGKVVLVYAAYLAIIIHACCAQTNPAPAVPTIKFDVVSFKRCEAIDLVRKNTDIPPDGDYVARHCQPVSRILDFAFFDIGVYQLKNEPAWVNTEPYEFQAKVATQDVPTWQKMDISSKRLMGRAMLADVLNLKMHIELQTRPVYALMVAKDGPKLTEHKPGPDEPPPNPHTPVHGRAYWKGPDEAVFENTGMPALALGLAARLDRNVVDKTGLTGTYDFTVKPLPYIQYDPKSPTADDSAFSAIIDGVRSLGLKLEPAKAETSVIVIDHIDRPPTN